MGVPTLEKGPWTFDVGNKDTGWDSMSAYQLSMLRIKNVLVSLGWTVVASSDGVSVKQVGDASPDLWIDYTDMIWNASGAHSWIILENSSFNDLQIAIDCNRNARYQADFWVSFVGFGLVNGGTDGTTSVLPTATDDYRVLNGSSYNWHTSDAVMRTTTVHGMMSADGHCTRIYIYSEWGSELGGFLWALDEPKNPVSGWNTPRLVSIFGNGWNEGTTQDHVGPRYDTNLGVLSNAAYAYVNGWNSHYLTGECILFGGSSGDLLTMRTSEVPWVLSAGFPVLPIGLYASGASRRGINGGLYDMWWAFQNHDTGDTYPVDASRQFIKFGCLILPWNGTLPVMV